MKQRFFKFRLLPLTLVASALFVVIKADEIAVGQKYLARGIIPPAYAQDAEAEPLEENAEATPATESEPVIVDDQAQVDDSDAEVNADAPEEASNDERENVVDGSKGPQIENTNVSLDPPSDIVQVDGRYSQIEVDLLQSLSKRREEIELYSEEVSMREKLLEATEMRINDKIQQMERMQISLKELLEQNEKQEDTEMKSLVKIYESMKPKEAARIFNELDMNILLEVIDRMSERKAAPILASMSPIKAKDVTVKLAQMRQIRAQATKDLAAASAPETKN